MEWVVLLLLVPAIVAPIVLLFGYSGCSFTVGVPPEWPTVVSAIPLDAHSVELKWNAVTGAASYEIERTKGGEPASAPITVTPAPEDPQRHVDSLLIGGTTYTYRVRAMLGGDGATTWWSNPAVVETWSRAFTSPIAQSGTNASVPGACVVQRLSPGTLSRGGNMIGVSLRGATDGDATLSRVTLSSPALSGDDFDSAASPLDLTNTPVYLDGGLSLPLQPAVFPVDVDEPLLIAVDVGDPGNGRFVPGVPHTAYVKEPPPGGTITEAGTQNRAGFVERANELWFVDAVDVATKWPPIL
jgi:hypothetical protein